MQNVCDVEISALRLDLLASGGLYWPSRRTLFVADTHLGKDATFCRNHVPVPAGTTEGTLNTITQMLHQTGAGKLVVLGDMFHARSSLSPGVCDLLDSFFARHGEVNFVLVRGNHDRNLGTLLDGWPIELVGQHRLGPLALAHHPCEPPAGTDLLLCGHLHPSFRLTAGYERLGKMPCFWLSDKQLVLPAVGEFTGSHTIRPNAGDRVWLMAEGQIVEHRPRGRNRRPAAG